MRTIQRLLEKGLAPGTVRKWGDDTYQKQRDGSWKWVAQGNGGAAKQHHIAPRPSAKVKYSRSIASPAPANTTSPTPKQIEIPTGRKWVDKDPELPDETIREHFETKDGKLQPKPARKALHDRIEGHFLDKVQPVPPDKKPVAIVMMGGPASGKTSIVRGVAKGDFVQVDPDAIKEMIPEYKQAVEHSARNAAAMAHEESSHIAGQIEDKAIEDRKNLVIDGTGKDADKHIAKIKKLKAKGYHVHLIMPHIEVDEAHKRARARAEATGRWVPEEIIDSAYSKVPKNFQKVAAEADQAALYNGQASGGPKLVFEKTPDGQSVDRDKEFMTQFRARHPAATVSKKRRAESVVVDVLALVEKNHPDTPSIETKAIQGRVREAAKKDRLNKPIGKKFKKGEGIYLVNYDDRHFND